jgi:hypothetical protein
VIIEENVLDGSIVHTDELKSYKGLKKAGYNHQTVNHGMGEYVNGDTHTKILITFGSTLKAASKAPTFMFRPSIFINTPKNLSIGSTPARTLPRCSPLWFHSSRNHRVEQFSESLFISGRILFIMLFDELIHLALFSGLFKIHIEIILD